MALSPQYSWPEPDNSSLVKNGAQDIRALGDAIDTSLWNVGYGQAGKNKIINGNFGIWQRGTSFDQTATYTADRWTATYGGATPTAAVISQQSFTPATAPVAGYEGQYFLRMVTTTIGSCTAAGFEQRIEDVRNFAGQTATISFWAKADAARSAVVVTRQNFGSGGSTATYVEAANVSLTTSWTRFTVTYAVPSISGKTIGTGSFLSLGLRMTTMANGGTMDLWGYQVEYGSKATPFQTASGGSPQAELAMCQRYYEKSYPLTAAIGSATTDNNIAWNAVSTASNRNYVWVPFKVVKRAAPTITVYSPITGTSGKLYNALTSAGDKNATANYIQDASFAIYLGPTDGANAVGDLLLAQYVASAEL